MLLQILTLLALIAAGTFLSYWMRRVEMSGFELWLPFGLLFSIAISPMAGILFALSILIASWFLFPYHPQWIAVMGVCLGITFYLTTFFTFTPANFVMQSLYFIIFYNIISNIAALFFGIDLLRAAKFFILSTWLSWLIYARFGWALVEFFAI